MSHPRVLPWWPIILPTLTPSLWAKLNNSWTASASVMKLLALHRSYSNRTWMEMLSKKRSALGFCQKKWYHVVPHGTPPDSHGLRSSFYSWKLPFEWVQHWAPFSDMPILQSHCWFYIPYIPINIPMKSPMNSCCREAMPVGQAKTLMVQRSSDLCSVRWVDRGPVGHGDGTYFPYITSSIPSGNLTWL